MKFFYRTEFQKNTEQYFNLFFLNFFLSSGLTNPPEVLPLKKVKYGLTLYVDTHQVPYVESQKKGVRFVFRPPNRQKPIWKRRLHDFNESKTEDEVDLSRRRLTISHGIEISCTSTNTLPSP